ncbi:MAG: ATPase, T2SS/T4P/T4SS family [Deltaproteobacteria bacterium]
MLIDPLKKAVSDEKKQEITPDRVNHVVSEIIGYLINHHADLLADVQTKPENSKNIERIMREKIYRDHVHINIDVNELVKKVLDRLFGYHILQKYIDDKNVSDIRVLDWDNIHIKRKGNWVRTKDRFSEPSDYYNFVRYCVLKNKGKITEEKPIAVVSDRKNKLRIEAGIPPVNIGSPNLVIRVHRPEFFTRLDELYSGDSYMMNLEIYNFLLEAVTAGCSIIISGKGGSGKTTLMRALIDKIPDNLAITSNEETAELFCQHPNIVQRQILGSREASRNITLENLTAQTLLMTNDVIIVGELKGAEAMVFFDAVSTGHRAYTTVHSDSAEMTLDRLVTLMKRDPQAQMYSEQYLKELLADSIDLIVYMKNFKVAEISEIIRDKEKRTISCNQLFKYKIREIVDGETKGLFLKLQEPKQKVKHKLELSRNEYRRIYGGVVIE